MARTTTARRPAPRDLQKQIDEIDAHPAKPAAVTPPASAPATEAVHTVYVEDPAVDRLPFGAWLVKQIQHKREWIANLAKMAKVDPGFPKSGSPDDVRKHLTVRGADGDAFEAVDDAETEWDRL